ncbi:MAG: YfhO family protein [Peptoniphilaceae bacterium]|nr:YfhO family protein [Peptoniphilaceae bacterium]MDY6085530.1 YfhO family protein [Peptoniphilaceae bacterium]
MSQYRTLMHRNRRGILSARRPGAKAHGRAFAVVMSFLIPIILLIPAFIVLDIFPFGGNTTLAVDLRNQYVGFFEAYKNYFTQPESFIYNWNKGMGGLMAGTNAYYLMSPLNLIFFLFPDALLPLAVELIQVIKIGLAGAFFCVYLQEVQHGEGWGAILFSTCYALMSYTVGNILNLMWFDPIYLAPLVLLFLERFFDGKSAVPYIMVLAFAILTNFYTAYMLCLFLVFYSIWTLVRRPRPQGMTQKEWAKTAVGLFVRFAFISVTAAAMTMWLILPNLYSLLLSKGPYQNNANLVWDFAYGLPDPLSRLLPAAFDYDEVQNGYADIYAGTISVIFGLFYFFNRHIRLREKVASAVVCVILLLCMNVKILNLIWHGIQYPIWYNFRFSWVFILFTLIIGYRSFRRSWHITLLQVGVVVAFYAALLIYIFVKKQGDEEAFAFLTPYHLVATAALVIVYLFFIHRTAPARRFTLYSAALFFVSCLEIAFNTAFYQGVYNYEPLAEFEFFHQALKEPSDAVKPGENEFYRVERTFRHDRNDGLRFDLSGLTHFNSTYEYNTIELMSTLGMARARASTDGGNSTKFTDGLFSIRYYMDGKYDEAQKDTTPGMSKLKPQVHRPDLANMTLADEFEYLRIYENPWAMPLGMLAEEPLSTYDAGRKNPMDVQDELANLLDGREGEINYFKRQPMSEETAENLVLEDPNADLKNYKREDTEDKDKKAALSWTFETDGSASAYLTMSETFNMNNSNVYLNDELVGNKRTGSVSSSQILNVSAKGDAPQQQKLEIRMKKDTDSFKLNHMALFTLDEAALKDEVAYQNQNGLKLDVFRPTYFKGTFTADETTPLLLLSLPYDEGWTAKLDGETVPTRMVLDALTAVDVTPGTHTVEFSFTEPLLYPGLALTVGGVFSFILLIQDERKAKRRDETKGDVLA